MSRNPQSSACATSDSVASSFHAVPYISAGSAGFMVIPAILTAGPSTVAERPRQHVHVDRLHDVGVEARGARALPIGVLPVAGDGDDARLVVDQLRRAQAGRQLVAVHDGQADVQQAD